MLISNQLIHLFQLLFHPFKEDLTMDGDVESNLCPITQEAIDSLKPDQWGDDEAIVEYSEVIFESAEGHNLRDFILAINSCFLCQRWPVVNNN
ncbi:hypothetical protein GEMRC1_014136 [Eukaryota sp. GEM-RC1]